MSHEMRGHEMSSPQLDELWKLDFKLAHELLGLPLRTCSAGPTETWGNPMEAGTFEKLKMQVRRMWLRAAVHFSCFSNEHGMGLKVNDHSEKNLSLTENSFTVLGWLAVSPSPLECPTGHRYLRSSIDKKLYLGGPISLTQWSRTPTVRGRVSSTNSPIGHGTFFVSTVKPLAVGTSITWNYRFMTETPTFFSVDKWQLDDCCDENSHSDVLNPPCSKCTSMKEKPRHSFKRARIVQAFKFCVYCGVNLEVPCSDYSNPADSSPPKRNLKPHFALHHAVQLCEDYGLEVDSEINGVSHASFFSHLHIVSRVLNTLENHNYQVVPACHIFKTLDRHPLSVNASCDEKDQFFCDFMYEAKEAFKKYRVVYVRGISVPSCYEDLLPVRNTSYDDVSWYKCKAPRSNLFSVKHVVPIEQLPILESEIQVSVENIVKTYSEL